MCLGMKQLYMITSTSEIIVLTCNLKYMFHVGIDKLQVIKIMLHVDIIYLACWGQYAII